MGNQVNLGHMNSEVLCKIYLVFLSFTALVTSETPLPGVRLHVVLKITRRNASIVALVTLEWLFSCVVPHHVLFQLTSFNAGKLASCASVRLFPRVGSFVPLHIA